MTVLSAWQNALSTTNPVGTRLERRSAGCMALILPMGAPRESQTASKLSQSPFWTPIWGPNPTPIDTEAHVSAKLPHADASFSGGHKTDDPEPVTQVYIRVFEDRTD
jgi:hypothetical protein